MLAQVLVLATTVQFMTKDPSTGFQKRLDPNADVPIAGAIDYQWLDAGVSASDGGYGRLFYDGNRFVVSERGAGAQPIVSSLTPQLTRLGIGTASTGTSLVVRAGVGQVASLQEWQSSGGAVLSSLGVGGRFATSVTQDEDAPASNHEAVSTTLIPSLTMDASASNFTATRTIADATAALTQNLQWFSGATAEVYGRVAIGKEISNVSALVANANFFGPGWVNELHGASIYGAGELDPAGALDISEIVGVETGAVATNNVYTGWRAARFYGITVRNKLANARLFDVAGIQIATPSSAHASGIYDEVYGLKIASQTPGAGSAPLVRAIKTFGTEAVEFTGPMFAGTLSGIGTTSPEAALHVVGGTDSVDGLLKLRPTDGDFVGMTMWPRASGADAAARSYQLAANYSANGAFEVLQSTTNADNPTNSVLTITSTGNMGLGVSPSASSGTRVFHAYGTSAELKVESSNSPSTSYLTIKGTRSGAGQDQEEPGQVNFWNGAVNVARIGAYRDGADDAGGLAFYARETLAGFPAQRVTISSTGTLRFNAALSAGADIGTSTKLLHGGATPTWAAVSLENDTTGSLGVARGGTGLMSYTVGDLLYADGATSLARLAGVATGNALISGGVGAAPSYGKVGLTTHVSGVLPIASGGTNSSEALSGSGSIVTHNGTAYTQGPAGTPTTVLHGNAAGQPTYSAVSLTADVTGTLAVTNGGTGLSSYTTGDLIYASGSTTLTTRAAVASGSVLASAGASTAPVWSSAPTLSGGVTLGSTGTAISHSGSGSTVDPNSGGIAAATCGTTSITVTGSVAGSPCVVGQPAGGVGSAHLHPRCRVSANGTVTLDICNTTTVTTLTPAAGTYSVRVFNP